MSRFYWPSFEVQHLLKEFEQTKELVINVTKENTVSKYHGTDVKVIGLITSLVIGIVELALKRYTSIRKKIDSTLDIKFCTSPYW